MFPRCQSNIFESRSSCIHQSFSSFQRSTHYMQNKWFISEPCRLIRNTFEHFNIILLNFGKWSTCFFFLGFFSSFLILFVLILIYRSHCISSAGRIEIIFCRIQSIKIKISFRITNYIMIYSKTMKKSMSTRLSLFTTL